MEGFERCPNVSVLPSGLVSRKDAAAFLGRQPKTLAKWSAREVGPAVRKVAGRAFYDFNELRTFARGPEQVAA